MINGSSYHRTHQKLIGTVVFSGTQTNGPVYCRFFILDRIRTVPTLNELKVNGSISPSMFFFFYNVPCFFHYESILGTIWSLSRDGLSEKTYYEEGLESNSVLDNSLMAASSGSKNLNALVLRNLPVQVSFDQRWLDMLIVSYRLLTVRNMKLIFCHETSCCLHVQPSLSYT